MAAPTSAQAADGWVNLSGETTASASPSSLTFRVHVNAFPDWTEPVTELRVMVSLPTTVTPISGSVAGGNGSCSAPVGKMVTCSFPALSEQTSRTIVVTGSTSPTGPLPMTLTAAVAASATSGLASPASPATTTAVLVASTQSVGLSVDDTWVYDSEGDDGNLDPQEQASFGFSVHNAGPASSTGTTARFDLPDQLQFVSASPGTCADDDGAVTCALGTVAAGSTEYFTVNLTAVSPGSGAFSVVVDSDLEDWDAGDNAGSVSWDVFDPNAADLSVTFPQEGILLDRADARRVFRISNDGPVSASNVEVTYTYPRGTTPIGTPTIENGTCSAPSDGTVTCSLAMLAAGASADGVVRWSSAGDQYEQDSVEVASSTNDPRFGNNEEQGHPGVGPSNTFDRSVWFNTYEEVGVSVHETGSTYTLTALVRNEGPVTSSASSLEIRMTEGGPLITAIDTPAGITCPAPTAPVTTCAVAALPAAPWDEHRELVLHLSAGSKAVARDLSVVWAADVADPNSGNNAATRRVRTVLPGAYDLRPKLWELPPMSEPGESQSTSISVTNSGPAPSPAGATLQVDAGAGRSITSATVAGGSCATSNAGRYLTCTLPAIGVGEYGEQSAIVALDFIGVAAPGSYVVSATTTGPAGSVEWFLANNTAQGSYEVVELGSVDLGIYGGVHPADADEFDDSWWNSWTIDNGGTYQIRAWVGTGLTGNTSADALVTFELPAGTTWVGPVDLPPGAACGAASNIVTCELGDLVEDGSDRMVVIEAHAPNTTGVHAVHVRIDGLAHDRYAGNDEQEFSFQTLPAGAVLLSGWTDLVDADGEPRGSIVDASSRFRLLTGLSNESSNAALDAAVRYELPAGMAFVDIVSGPDGATCTQAGPQLDCSLGDLAAGWTQLIIELAAPATTGRVDVSWSLSTSSPNLLDPDNGSTSGATRILVRDTSSRDLAIGAWATGADGRSEIRAGATYELRVDAWWELEPPAAQAANVVVRLPAGVTFATNPVRTGSGNTFAGVTCSVVASTASCVVPSAALVNGDADVLTLLVIASAAGRHDVSVEASLLDGPDLDASNDRVTVNTYVYPAAGTPPVDVCSNIDGVQAQVPAGMTASGGTCTTPAPPRDVCSNIDGVQASVPAGLELEGTSCVSPPPPFDACPNISGVQDELPVGMAYDDAGRCVRPRTTRDVLTGDDDANRIDGGGGDDKLYGGGGNDALIGGLGLDLLYGGLGDDRLDGGAGNDRLDGGEGRDTLLGGAGDDQLTGGNGPDTLDGGAGRDSYSGGAGNDLIRAKDRVTRERITCGPGRDTVVADRRDSIARDCEVRRLS